MRSKQNRSAEVRRPRKTNAALRAALEPLEVRRLLSTVVVNSTGDGTQPAGFTTLRMAVAIANSSTTPTTITFDPTTFASNPYLYLSNGDIVLTNTAEPTTIVATGPQITILPNATRSSGALDIGAGVTATFTNIAVSATADSPISNGGTLFLNHVTLSQSSFTGFSNSGTATLTDCLITNNNHDGDNNYALPGPVPFSGGGIINTGNIVLQDTSVVGNTSNYGAGIYNYAGGVVDINQSNISGNGAQTLTYIGPVADPAGDGGGIENYGTINLTDSTLSNNYADRNGGGINDIGGVVTAVNSTFAGNTATEGGAIYQASYTTPFPAESFHDCTISANSATNPGGGIFNASTSGITFSNTIIAGDTAASDPDISGVVTSLGNNLVGATDGSSGWLASDLTGTSAHPLNAQVGTLASNGGPTQTMLPTSNSPALDAGSVALIPRGITTDQIGSPRVVGGSVDIGAVEVQPSITITPPPNQTASASQSHTFNLGSVTQVKGTAPYTATINWGDGSASSTVQNILTSGSIGSLSHTYASGGTDTVTVTLTDSAGVTSKGSFTVAITGSQPPAMPTGLTAALTGVGAIDLTWTDNGTSATSYLVERRYQGVTAFTTIATLPAGTTSYVDTSPTGNVVYDYEIVAVNNAGTAASPITSIYTLPAPAAATALAATYTPSGAVDLSWTDNSLAATSYLVQRRYQGVTAFTTIATLPAGAKSYADTSAIGNVGYDYRIVAVNNAGTAASAVASVYTLPQPTAPTGLIASLSTAGAVDLSWINHGTAATSYVVKRRYKGAPTFTTIATLSAVATSYADTSAIANVIYDYEIVAVNGAGNAASAVVSISTAVG